MKTPSATSRSASAPKNISAEFRSGRLAASAAYKHKSELNKTFAELEREAGEAMVKAQERRTKEKREEFMRLLKVDFDADYEHEGKLDTADIEKREVMRKR